MNLSRSTINFALIYLSLALVACGSEEISTLNLSDHYGVQSAVGAGNGFNVTSFNVGFLHGIVPYVDERRHEVINAIKQEETDVICLQEIWLNSDMLEVKNSLKQTFPFSAELLPTQFHSAKNPICSIAELTDILGDAGEAAATDYVKCAFEHKDTSSCALTFGQIDSENRLCAEALFSQIADHGIENLVKIRETLLSSDPGRYSFSGSSGLLLLSKKPFIDTSTLDFAPVDTAVSRRGVIFAKIDTDGTPVSIACTHLASNTNLPYPGSHENWEGEGLAQAKALIEKAEEFANGSEIILTGDFNCGIGNSEKKVLPELESVCNTFTEAGFTDASSDVECTYCNYNTTTTEVAPGGDGWLLDHIFVSSGLSATPSQRVFMDVFEVN